MMTSVCPQRLSSRCRPRVQWLCWYNLLCEWKNREHFDLILTSQLCVLANRDKREKLKITQPNYCCWLQLSFLILDWWWPKTIGQNHETIPINYNSKALKTPKDFVASSVSSTPFKTHFFFPTQWHHH